MKQVILLQRLFEDEPDLVGVSYAAKYRAASSTIFPYKVPDNAPDIRLLDPSTPAPTTKKAAEKSIYWPHYSAAEKLEVATLTALGVWDLVDRSEVTEGAKVLRGRWVYAHKKKDGKVIFAKARYVAQGCFQTEGVDYDSTFASVMTLKSWRMMLALANSDPDIELGHADIKAAYVMAKRDIPAFCEQPQGHELGTEVGLGVRKGRKVCRLKHSLYGCRDAGYLWQKCFYDHIKKLGYKALPSDPACYFKQIGKEWCWIATYVDDIFLCTNSPRLRDELLEHMASEWEVKYDPELQWALNTKISRDRETGVLKVSQEGYIRELLTKFGMSHAHPAMTPAKEVNDLPHPDEVTQEEMDKVKDYRFRELVGALLWIATVSRPDIAVAVMHGARHQHRPTLALWSYLCRILRYLKKYPDFGLVYTRKNIPKGTSPLELFVDASFAPEVEFHRGKSFLGYVVFFLGCAVHWVTTKSKRTLLSSTEAECNGLSEAMKENTWHRDLLGQIGIHKMEMPTPIFEDNSGTRALCESKTYHKRSKHFGLEWYATKEKIADKEAEIRAVGTDSQLADFLTKPLGVAKHDSFRDKIMGTESMQRFFEKIAQAKFARYLCRYNSDRAFRNRS